MTKVLLGIKELLSSIALMILAAIAAFFIMRALSDGLTKTAIPEVSFEITYNSPSGDALQSSDQSGAAETSNQYGVSPGVSMNNPVTATNTGNTDSYVFITIKQPLCQNPVFYEGTDAILEADGSAPLYILNPNTGWTQVDEEIKDGRLYTTFAYETILAPGERADPVLDSMTMQNFTNPYYSRIEDLNFETVIFGGAVSEFEGCESSADRWEIMKKYQ